jgi:hypothetical protein
MNYNGVCDDTFYITSQQTGILHMIHDVLQRLEPYIFCMVAVSTSPYAMHCEHRNKPLSSLGVFLGIWRTYFCWRSFRLLIVATYEKLLCRAASCVSYLFVIFHIPYKTVFGKIFRYFFWCNNKTNLTVFALYFLLKTIICMISLLSSILIRL